MSMRRCTFKMRVYVHLSLRANLGSMWCCLVSLSAVSSYHLQKENSEGCFSTVCRVGMDKGHGVRPKFHTEIFWESILFLFPDY